MLKNVKTSIITAFRRLDLPLPLRKIKGRATPLCLAGKPSCFRSVDPELDSLVIYNYTWWPKSRLELYVSHIKSDYRF
jgi:hypothetical protein